MVKEGMQIRTCIMAVILGLLLLCIVPMSSVSAGEPAIANGETLKLNGEIVKITDPVYTLDGRLYVPVARIAEILGAKASWDNVNEEVTIHTAFNDHIVLGNGVPVVYFNEGRYQMEAVPVLMNGRLYVPLRQLSEMMHANVTYNPESGIVELTRVQPAIITEEYGLDEISKAFGSSKSELLKRNGLDGKATIKPGTKLKVVIPSIFNKAAKPYTQSDLMLLAKITMVESGNETYEGQLGLANVILNRVKDASFPDTIHDVIYSGKQFPPAHNGKLDKSKPNASSLRAAKDALNGKNNVENALYFFNPDVSKGSFWSSLDVIVTIGSHSFAS
ncbi:spore germination cell wall hydrolase CwlJ-like protein [Paenibacillus castaneae]|uniref:cell wall hydrolase n=2 Tax=Paenibacillus castaneae TaxID=474957 RepID=UPI001FD4F037|nr:cell wall hydrolase [Paenibacillus castaneae]NIK77012.1 spore germination cell wall hydrolase CwlJ-like protein [Paenibacillus castaneae]